MISETSAEPHKDTVVTDLPQADNLTDGLAAVIKLEVVLTPAQSK